jgi:Tfp pilus assembly protein PilZ
MTTPLDTASQRRRHRRYDVHNVHGSLVYAMDAQVLNISLTGLAIETQHALRVGTEYTLRLSHQGHDLRLRTRVKWCRLVRTASDTRGNVLPVFHAGLDFREALGEVARELLGFIEDHVEVELERRILGRFRLREAEDVELDAEHEFLVRRISLSGMLIQTDLAPRLDALLELEVRLPHQLLSCRGRIAYVRPVDNHRRNESELGIEFQSLEELDRRAIERLIEDLIE